MLFPRLFQQVRWLLVGVGALGAAALSANPGWTQTPSTELDRDLWQTVQARKLLLEDPQLGPLNLGVKVTNRVAVLWGPIPSAQLAFRAEQRLRIMFELVEIRNCFTIEPDDQVAPAWPRPPGAPQILPEAVPPQPKVPRPPVILPDQRVELAGIEVPLEGVTVHSSPLGASTSSLEASPMLRLPFLGSIFLPR